MWRPMLPLYLEEYEHWRHCFVTNALVVFLAKLRNQTVTISVLFMIFKENVELKFTNYFMWLSNKIIHNITAHVIITRKSKKSLYTFF